MGTAIRWMVGMVAALVLVAIGWWAGQVTLSAPDVDAAAAEVVLATVEEGKVGRTLSLGVTVEQPFSPIATNGLAGTVTEVADLDTVATGDVLYAVDAVPVRVVPGAVPFWRDMATGIEGQDVEQLQHALGELGHHDGAVDGRFAAATAAAVRRWQRASGLPATGAVRLGELVAVPALPARVRLDEAIVTSARLGGGEPAVFAPSGRIDFRLVVSSTQAAMLPPDAAVAVDAGEARWDAVAAEAVGSDDGTVRYSLRAVDGGPVCGDRCDLLPAQERTTLPAEVVVVPEVSGPIVPAAAVRTDPDGSAHVVLDDGTRQPIEVLGSADGLVVVDGVPVGTRIRVLEPVGPSRSPDERGTPDEPALDTDPAG